ncbi:hypothetical protein KCU96_g15651, partial [Aureobasidium melanogenum]
MADEVIVEESSIPGTVHLVDLDGTMHAQHARGGQRDIVLVPTPSQDPDDPLNWSPRRKTLSMVCMGIYTLMVGIASAAIYSILEPISQETSLTLNELNNGTGCTSKKLDAVSMHELTGIEKICSSSSVGAV